MKHGEQLAPLIEGALGSPAWCGRTSPRSASASAPARSPGCGSAWSPPAPSRTCSSCPVYGVCSLDVLAVEAVATGPSTGEFVVASDARRKEVYLATYDEDGRRLTGPLVDKPAALATEGRVVGEGAAPLPRGVPARRRSAPRPARAGWPAPSPRSWPSCSTPSRSTCAVRTRWRPAPRSRSRDQSTPRPRDADAISGSRPSASAPTPGRARSSSGASAATSPTVHYLVAEDDGEVVGVRRGQHRGRRRRAAADRRTAGLAAPGSRHRAARRRGRAGRRRTGRPAAAGGARGQHRRAGLLRVAAASSRSTAAPATTATAATAIVLRPPCEEARMNDGPLVLGHRDLVRRDGRRHRPRSDAAGRRHRQQRRRACPLRRRRARGRQPGAPRGDGARRSSAPARPRARAPRRRRDRGHQRPRARRRSARRCGCGEGTRPRPGEAVVRRQPPRRPRRGRPARAR